MDFTLSKKHEMARALFREFAEKEVKPLAQEVDETEEFPRVTVEKIKKRIVRQNFFRFPDERKQIVLDFPHFAVGTSAETRRVHDDCVVLPAALYFATDEF